MFLHDRVIDLFLTENVIHLVPLPGSSATSRPYGIGRIPAPPGATVSDRVCSCHGRSCSCVSRNLTHSVREDDDDDDDGAKDGYEGAVTP